MEAVTFVSPSVINSDTALAFAIVVVVMLSGVIAVAIVVVVPL